MTTLRKIAVIAALAVAILMALYQASQASNSRIEARDLRAQQAQLHKQISVLHSHVANLTNQLADLLAENSRLKNDSNQRELRELRSEVTRLRPLQDDVVALQKLLSQSSAGLAEWKTNELADSGRDTPVNALQSCIYSFQFAPSQLQTGIVGDDVDPPDPEALQKFIKKKTDDPSPAMGMDIVGITGYKILSQTWLASDKVQMELQMSVGQGAVGISLPFTLRKVGEEWKLVVFNVRDQQGKVSQLEFVNRFPR